MNDGILEQILTMLGRINDTNRILLESVERLTHRMDALEGGDDE